MSIVELAVSIKECGVLQNLVVAQGARGHFEVCAGGRRLEALTLLVGKGELADNYPVPVLIVPADRALIASLSENCFHIPMHPADEFVAFAKLIGQGKSVEDVGAAFGITPLVVKCRIKLATVSPKLMAIFREDQIGLDCLMVLASVDDHQKQEQTWAALPSWNRRPDYLRQLLTQLVLSRAQASGLDCHPQAPGKSGGLLDECAADLRRSQTPRRLESGPVVPNLSFEKMPEGEMPCEMKRPADSFTCMLPSHIVPKSTAGRGQYLVWRLGYW